MVSTRRSEKNEGVEEESPATPANSVEEEGEEVVDEGPIASRPVLVESLVDGPPVEDDIPYTPFTGKKEVKPESKGDIVEPKAFPPDGKYGGATTFTRPDGTHGYTIDFDEEAKRELLRVGVTIASIAVGIWITSKLFRAAPVPSASVQEAWETYSAASG